MESLRKFAISTEPLGVWKNKCDCGREKLRDVGCKGSKRCFEASVSCAGWSCRRHNDHEQGLTSWRDNFGQIFDKSLKIPEIWRMAWWTAWLGMAQRSFPRQWSVAKVLQRRHLDDREIQRFNRNRCVVASSNLSWIDLNFLSIFRSSIETTWGRADGWMAQVVRQPARQCNWSGWSRSTTWRRERWVFWFNKLYILA